MRFYKADLHVHTVLSPCGSLEMSPKNIITRAREMDLDILGITDHNSTRQCEVMQMVGAREGIHILCGVEINTREEVHCLAFFDQADHRKSFEKMLDDHLANIRNDPEKFGYQVLVDEAERILDQPEKLLISAIDMGVEEVEKRVHEMGGIFIPAHIDRMRNGIIAQLGFIPDSLRCDAVEISPFAGDETLNQQHQSLEQYTVIRGSDAHYLNDIGKVHTRVYLEHVDFADIKMALAGVCGRKVEVT